MAEYNGYDNKQKQLIHQLIEAIFSGEALDEFCATHFRPVFEHFTPDMGTTAKIRLLVETCSQQSQLGRLIARIQQVKPEAYQSFVQRTQKPAQKSTPLPAARTAPASSSTQITAPTVPSAAPRADLARRPENLLRQSLAGRYRIDEILDKGGLGAVFKAYDTKLELPVAIKVIDLNRVKLPAMRERVQQEVRTAMKLNHPGIVQFYDFGQADSLLYLIMEFISGHNLREARRQFQNLDKRVVLAQLLELMQQICLTLDYMHQQGVLHPNLEPKNIMLKPDQVMQSLAMRPVLINLGLLRPHREALRSEEELPVDKLTYSVSPELLLGHATDIRSDVYGLGIILYELVVGQPPFRPKNLAEAMHLHVEESPPAPRSINPDLPEAIEMIILKALAKDPVDRYLSAKGLAQALASNTLKAPHLPALGPQADIILSLEEEASLVVTPGESLTTILTLRNEGKREDHRSIKLQGVPPEWVSLSPSAMTLTPGEQQEVELTIQPPRAPQSRAGRYALTIQAISQREPKQIDEIKKTLNVAPYVQFYSALWPQEISAGQTTQVTIENQGNMTSSFIVKPKPDRGLTIKPDQAQLKLAPGESKVTDFQVIPRRPWIGPPTTRTFSFLINTAADQMVMRSGQVTCRGLLAPRWVVAAVLLIVLLSCLVIAFNPILNPSPENQAATAAIEKATLDAATAQIVEAQTATVVAGTAQAVATQDAVTRSTQEREAWFSRDDDFDGLSNRAELEAGTLPNNRDTDGDGLDDTAEITQFRTKPLAPDTDYDGLLDGQEVQLGLSPLSPDTDGDGIPDSIDEAPRQPPTSTPTFTPIPTPTRLPTATPLPTSTPVRLPLVRFENTNYNIDEWRGEARIRAILDFPINNQALVNVIIGNSSAQLGNDYRAPNNSTLVFNPNQTVQEFVIPIINDTLAEPDETIILNLSSPQNATLGFNSQAVVTIIDDD